MRLHVACPCGGSFEYSDRSQSSLPIPIASDLDNWRTEHHQCTSFVAAEIRAKGGEQLDQLRSEYDELCDELPAATEFYATPLERIGLLKKQLAYCQEREVELMAEGETLRTQIHALAREKAELQRQLSTVMGHPHPAPPTDGEQEIR